jgi:type IV pilus assembly protein PilC
VPWFEYEGLAPGGTAVAGRIEAESHEAARRVLSETMQVTLGEVRTAEVRPAKAPISAEEFQFFNEQLASLASAGLALDEGLQQLARDVDSPRLRRFIDDVVSDLRRGEPLEQAIGKHEAQLPVLYSRVIRAGIQTGRLPETLLDLNQHLRLMGQTRQVLWEILSYPVLLLAVGLTIVSVFFLAVVPQFRVIFSDFGTDLPAPTALLMAVSEGFPTILIVGGLILACVVIGWRLLPRLPRGRPIREWILARVPIVGRVYRASLVSRFVRSVATGVQAGIPLPDALRLAGGVTGSPGLGAEADRVAAAVEQGGSIFNATQLCVWIPVIFGYTVQVALGRDALPAALLQLSESYESRATHYQSMLKVVLFPGVVIFVGGLMALGVIGLFMPMVCLINAVSG